MHANMSLDKILERLDSIEQKLAAVEELKPGILAVKQHCCGIVSEDVPLAKIRQEMYNKLSPPHLPTTEGNENQEPEKEVTVEKPECDDSKETVASDEYSTTVEVMEGEESDEDYKLKYSKKQPKDEALTDLILALNSKLYLDKVKRPRRSSLSGQLPSLGNTEPSTSKLSACSSGSTDAVENLTISEDVSEDDLVIFNESDEEFFNNLKASDTFHSEYTVNSLDGIMNETGFFENTVTDDDVDITLTDVDKSD